MSVGICLGAKTPPDSKYVLVCGGKGFIGTHTVKKLLANGFRVAVYDILSGEDILDFEQLNHAVDSFRPCWIIHLAGQVNLKPSLENPQNDAKLNIIGSLNVLEAARKHGCGVTFSSSGAIYGNNYQYPDPVSPYGVSKLCLWYGSKVLTEKGWKKIKDVQIGDKVFTHKGHLNKVTNTFARQTDELVHIYLGASRTNIAPQNCLISSTLEHPFLTERGWVKASNLTFEDRIFVLSRKCKSCGLQYPYWWGDLCKKCSYDVYRESHKEGIRKMLKKFNGRSPNPNWNVPEDIAKRIRKGLIKKGINSQEFYLDLLIQKTVPNTFRYVGNGQYSIGTYFPDWINEERKLIIEYEGFMSDRRKPEHFEKRTKFIKDAGWKTLTLKTKDFNRPQETMLKIQGFVNNPILYNDLHEVTDENGKLMFVAVPIRKLRRVHTKTSQLVCNLEVENDESYIAQGMVVHNCAETYMRLYNKLYNLHTVVFRFSSVYGVGRAPTSINLILQKAMRGETIKITGDGEQTRDFTFVADVAEALALSAEAKLPSGVYDIGTGTATSLNELIGVISVLLHKKVNVEYIPESVGDPKRNELNVSKAAMYGWKAKTSLEDGLKQMISQLK